MQDQTKTKTVTFLKAVVGHQKDHFPGDIETVPEDFANMVIGDGRAVEGRHELKRRGQPRAAVGNGDPGNAKAPTGNGDGKSENKPEDDNK